MRLTKKQDRENQKKIDQLKADREQCWKEIFPILVKYNLIIHGKIQVYDDAIIATPVLIRAPEPKEPPKSEKVMDELAKKEDTPA